MTGDVSWCDCAPSSLLPKAVGKDDDFLRAVLDYQLQNFCFEALDTAVSLGTIADSRKISGALFYSLEPKLIRLLIADARTSIVLAFQRHLDNERYRRRLKQEPHYRAFLPYLSSGFRVMMMPPSNWNGYYSSASRKPDLILAYQKEIERLELELQTVPERMGLHFPRSSLRQTAM